MKVVASFAQREKKEGEKNMRGWESLEGVTAETGRERAQ